MVRIVGLLVSAVPVFGARVAVNQHSVAYEQEQVSRGLEVLEQLKANPEDVDLQNEYAELIGEVEFGENRVFLETGVKIEQEPAQLGQMSSPGSVLIMAEATGISETIGRILTNRRDYVWEREGGHVEYAFDGSTLSLHSRMHVAIGGEENPRFIVRRAFNYLNPIAGLYGQFVYRVIQCVDPHDDSCSEGDILYTITKDRLGRGALWGRDEYRVYHGTGGCGRWTHGLVGCHQDSQILYSLGSPLASGSFDTDFYKGNIVAIHGSGEEGTVSQHGSHVRVGDSELSAMKIGHTQKTEGAPRWLNWPFLVGFRPLVQTARTLVWTDSYRLIFEGEPVDELLVASMVCAQDLTRDYISNRALAHVPATR